MYSCRFAPLYACFFQQILCQAECVCTHSYRARLQRTLCHMVACDVLSVGSALALRCTYACFLHRFASFVCLLIRFCVHLSDTRTQTITGGFSTLDSTNLLSFGSPLDPLTHLRHIIFGCLVCVCFHFFHTCWLTVKIPAGLCPRMCRVAWVIIRPLGGLHQVALTTPYLDKR